MSLEYYLGKIGMEKHSSEQARLLRNIILTEKPEPEIISEFKQFILSQKELSPDTVSIINKALMPQYGSEYLGFGKDDYSLKSILYKQFIDKFPGIFSFKFYSADCCLLAGKQEDEIFPILKEGMLQDKENINYPSSELFEFIHNSEFSFEFDMLLLEKYYQPCDKEVFDDWLAEFKEQYKSKEQQDVLEKIRWKGEIGGIKSQV